MHFPRYKWTILYISVVVTIMFVLQILTIKGVFE